MNEFFHINMNESNSNANIQYHNKLFEIWETIKNKIPIKKNIDYKKFSKKLKSSIIRREETEIFIDKFFDDILEMLKEKSLSIYQNKILYIFSDFLSSLGKPLEFYPKEKTIEVLNLLYMVNPNGDCCFLDLLLEPLCADDIVSNKTHRRPFIDFLINTYADDTFFSKASQKIILLMLKHHRNSTNYLILSLNSSFLDLFNFFSSISPTLYDNNSAVKLLEFSINVLTIRTFQMNYMYVINDNFCSLLQMLFKMTPSYMNLKTVSILFSKLKQKSILSTLVNLVIDPNSYFAQNISAWLMNHTSDTLKLLISMLNIRSGAVKSAYFYLDDSEPILLTYFPKLEKKADSFVYNPYSLLKTNDIELPEFSNHVISVLPLILDLFSKFWSSSIETDELLLNFIKRFASIKNDDSMTFCFIAGKNISKLTDDLLEQMDSTEQEKSVLIQKFVNSMNCILKG